MIQGLPHGFVNALIRDRNPAPNSATLTPSSFKGSQVVQQTAYFCFCRHSFLASVRTTVIDFDTSFFLPLVPPSQV